MSSDSFSVKSSPEQVELHGVGLSSGGSSTIVDNFSDEILKLNDTYANNETQTEERKNVRYSQILREIDQQQKDVESTEIIPAPENNWIETITKISSIVKPIFGIIQIPDEEEKQQQLIISIIENLVKKIQEKGEIQVSDFERIKEKNKKLKEKVTKLNEEKQQLLYKIQEQNSDNRRQINEISSKKDKQINENIEQIKKLVKEQQRSQKRLLKELDESESSSSICNEKKYKKYKHYTTKETDITKTRRIPFPQESSSKTTSSSEVYIVRTKPKKAEKVIKVNKYDKNNDDSSSSSSIYSESSEDEKIVHKKYSKSQSKHKSRSITNKVNQLISLTNRIQGEYNLMEPDNDLSMSTLSMIHDSLLNEEKKFK